MFSPFVHRILFLFGLCTLAWGMMLGTVPTSIPQFILLGNWLLEMDFKRKWQTLKGNAVFWLLSSVLIIHAIGILHSQDLQTAWNEVRTKIPLMFLPMIFFSTRVPEKKELHLAFYCFLLGTFINIFWCYVYTFVLHKNDSLRSSSRFMSHIRLGLYLNMAIAVCVYFISQYKRAAARMLLAALILFFLAGIYVLGLASGFANFIILCTLAVILYAWKHPWPYRLLTVVAIAVVTIFVTNYINRVYQEQVIEKSPAANVKLDKTANGRNYFHFDSSTQKENGYIVNINLQFEELAKEWNKRVPEDTFNFPQKTNLQRFQVLTRYLSSKGAAKDSVGVWSLTASDIENIRADVTNYQLTDWSNFHRRVYELVNEYDEFVNNRDVSGHSINMRLYFWKAALYIIPQHWLTGVGTGDVQSAMNVAFKEIKAPLNEEWYRRPHNQFLSVAVALGITGLFVFLIQLFYPVWHLRIKLHPLYWPFFTLALISFLMEDTLETQAGVTFFAFFNSLFLSMAAYRRIEN